MRLKILNKRKLGVLMVFISMLCDAGEIHIYNNTDRLLHFQEVSNYQIYGEDKSFDVQPHGVYQSPTFSQGNSVSYVYYKAWNDVDDDIFFYSYTIHSYGFDMPFSPRNYSLVTPVLSVNDANVITHPYISNSFFVDAYDDCVFLFPKDLTLSQCPQNLSTLVINGTVNSISKSN